jgi:hypothetical protein
MLWLWEWERGLDTKNVSMIRPPEEIRIRTNDLIRSNLAQFPIFSLIGFFDQVDLRIVEDFVSPG